MQTDHLKGSEVSLDDASPANLERLVQTAMELLDEEVATRDIDTGELKPTGNGETNREALQRCCQQVNCSSFLEMLRCEFTLIFHAVLLLSACVDVELLVLTCPIGKWL